MDDRDQPAEPISANDRLVAAINSERRIWSDASSSKSRLVSLVIASTYLSIGMLAEGFTGLLRGALFLVLPLACIWFGESMGRVVSGRITKATPGEFVVAGGWLVLLLPVIAGVVSAMSGACRAH